MLKPTHSPIMHRQAEARLIPLYAIMLLLIFHSMITVYINSFYLTEFITEAKVGVIYTVGSAVGLLLFLFISRVLHRVGNYKLTMLLLILDFIAVFAMAFAESARVLVPLFLVHFITLPIIFFNIDVFIEAAIDNNESSTGSKRGLLLTLSSLVSAVTPIITGALILQTGDFTLAYIICSLSILPVIALAIANFRQFKDPPYDELDIMFAIRSFWERINIRLVFLASFYLQIFFSFTVIYFPLYLVRDLGLSWEDFGIIMAVAILAYAIFEYPIGVIADRYTGEKEIMAFGFLIIILVLASTSFITSTSVLLWSALMFVSRIGASLVEVTTESYFFKKTKSSDAQIISFFRATRPLSYIVTALAASLALSFLPFNLLFVVAAIAMIPAMFFAMALVDTK
jgi:MFS family permease